MRRVLYAIVIGYYCTLPVVAGSPVDHQLDAAPATLTPQVKRTIWSEPPDLNGVIMTSELIGEYGLETEVVNDFIPTEPTVTRVTWWGGYNPTENPCDPGIPTPGFNLRFYADDDCTPGSLLAALEITDFTEQFVECRGNTPIYRYDADVRVDVAPGNRYWVCAQMLDHPYPPQWGRLESTSVVECESLFRSDFYGYPDWIGMCHVIFEVCDASQEFEGDHSEACCFADGHCEYLLTSICIGANGVPQGVDVECDPNPCEATAIRIARWGSVKQMFR